MFVFEFELVTTFVFVLLDEELDEEPEVAVFEFTFVFELDATAVLSVANTLFPTSGATAATNIAASAIPEIEKLFYSFFLNHF